jgi:hypothetical protein
MRWPSKTMRPLRDCAVKGPVMRNRLIAVCGVIASLAVVPSAAHAGPPPSLAGTWLEATGSPTTNQVTGQCEVTGDAMLHDTWSGRITAGPYAPGTYTETATVVLGPAGEPGLYFGPTGHFGLPGRGLRQLTSHVVITSGATTIEVDQTPDPARPEAGGTCSVVTDFTDQNLLYWYDLADHDFQTFSLWSATITTPAGRFGEAGRGWIVSTFADGHYDYVRPDGSHTPSGYAATGNFVNLYDGDGPKPLGPAHVSLTPPDGTGLVGGSHTVSATVTDAGGGGISAITVLLRVTGADTHSTTCTTDPTGSCSSTYSGPDFPGADEIQACADANANGSVDPDEPCGTATQAWLLPAATDGRVTGGGQISNATNTDQIAFGFNAQADGASFKGQGTLVDPATATKIKLIDVTTFSRNGAQATIFGHATVDGIATGYRLDVADNAEPGAGVDTFRLRTSGGYLVNGTLTRGNIQSR